MAVDGASIVLLDDVVLGFGRGGPNLLYSGPFAKLQGSGPNPTCSTVNEHLVLRPEMAEVMQHVVRRHVGDGCRGRCLERNPFRKRNDTVNRSDNKAGLTAPLHGGHDLLSYLNARYVLAKSVNDTADFVAGGEGKGRAGLIEPHSHQEVSKVDSSISDFDSNFAFVWHW